MKITFGGYGEKLITFEVTEGALVGVLVMVSANGVVAPCVVGKAFCGVVVNVRDGLAAVQLAGYVRLPYTDMAPAVGYQTLAGDGAGRIKTDAVGRRFPVVDVDTSATVCGVILQRKRRRAHGFL